MLGGIIGVPPLVQGSEFADVRQCACGRAIGCLGAEEIRF